ncbi:hypothetical protein BTO30_00495 [Domibacillus antri]|uniref:Uncharacterized protein n=1 Tax=Domibacillus antri TaxID=1714264 RepID=A0A1Q8Q9C1_9BACI|nr:ParM/StbA family protein [Domibacillus antri]OLN23944.1 hypothetical protein BTO30_00495 [Domibacillus antri]
MREHVFIGIDTGKHSTKVLMEHRGKTYTLLFRTKMQETYDLGVEVQPSSYKIDFEGRQFLLGDMSSESQSDFNLSKETLIHQVSIYTAICEIMRKANIYFHNVQLHVAVNVPINVYKSKTQKESFKRFIENNGKTIYFRVNDCQYNFNLTDVTICFEGMGLIYSNSSEVKNSSSTVIDIGGLNTTYCVFNGIQPDFSSMTVSHAGINILKAKLEQALVQKYNRNVSATDLELLIQRGYISYMGQIEEDSKKIIAQVKQAHFEQIINYAKQHNYTFNQDFIYFVGGGALLLQKEISEQFPNAKIVINPQFANVKSFLEIVKVKYA